MSSGGAPGSGGGGGEVERNGIVVQLGAELIEFRRGSGVNASRAPVLEISATNTGRGTVLLTLVPEGDTQLEPGVVLRCGSDGASKVSFSWGSVDTEGPGGACEIYVTEAGEQTGSRLKGSFGATLVAADGSGMVQMENGSFLGVLE